MTCSQETRISASRRRRCRVWAWTLLTLLLLPGPANAQASGVAFLKLIEILRDRGSITAEEYEQLKMALTGPGDVAAASSNVEGSQAPSRAADGGGTPRDVPTIRWYERFNVRGYTQFRTSEVFGGDGPVPLEMPSDRSVLPNETFVLRRGRFILSGDVGEHLSIYAQPDFSASTGAPDFSLQLRDLYADVTVDRAKTLRFRVGQSKVPFGFVNLQSSQSRGPFERPDALNFAVEGERDLGAYVMWAPPQKRQLFADLVAKGLKGSGDYGVVAVGAYDGQGPNRSDLNGQPHWVARASYPFVLTNGQIFELGVQGYSGRFVTSTQALSIGGNLITPSQAVDGRRPGVESVAGPRIPQAPSTVASNRCRDRAATPEVGRGVPHSRREVRVSGPARGDDARHADGVRRLSAQQTDR